MDEKTHTIKQTALITGLSEDTLRYCLDRRFPR